MLTVERETSYQDAAELDTMLRGVAAGDRDALARLYRYARTAVYGLALGYLKNPEDARDVTQDVFVRVWEAAPDYRPSGSPMGWILTITKNLCLSRLRREERRGTLDDREWDAIPDEGPAVSAEDRAALQTALAALGEQERRVVLLHAAGGLKHREIAKLLELPLPTVLSKYHRALKKLRILLEGGDAP